MPRFVLASFAAAFALAVMLMSGGGFVTALGLVLFWLPILFTLFVLGCIVTGAAFLVGLPLQLIPRAKAWWSDHEWVSWVIAAVGVLAFVFARVLATPHVWVDDEGFSQTDYDSPPLMLFGGIFLWTFGLLWIPRRAKQLPLEPAWPDGVPGNS